jgi:16S rRNA processing protein RimM
LTDLLAVGVVMASHGLKGELTVKSFSGSIEHLASLTTVLLRRGAEERTVAVRSVRSKPPNAVMKIDGVDTPEDAGRLRGFEIWVPRSAASPLEDGEYYAVDLCGCSMLSGAERVGRVLSVVEAGASNMLEVEGTQGKVFLVPFTEHFIGEVDLGARTVQLREREIVP